MSFRRTALLRCPRTPPDRRLEIEPAGCFPTSGTHACTQCRASEMGAVERKECISDETAFTSQTGIKGLKVFRTHVPHHPQQFSVILPFTAGQQLAQQTPQILSPKGNRLPHRPFIFIMSLKFQIKTPGCASPSTAVHLSSHLLYPLSIFLSIFPSTLYLSQ